MHCFFAKADESGAVEYNDFLICWQDHLEEAILMLGDEVEKGNEVRAYQVLDSIRALIVDAKISIKAYEPYNLEYEYQQAALDWWNFYKQVFMHEYPEILKISFHKNLREKNLKQLSGYLKNIQVAEKFASHEFKVAQKRFALKYDLYLE